MRHFFALLSLLTFLNFAPGTSQAQTEIPVGTWRSHLSYYDARRLVARDQAVWAISGNGFWGIDLITREQEILSKVNDLSDTQVSDAVYDPATGSLLIGYQNGNLDLLSENAIINIRTVLNARFSPRNVHRIIRHNRSAYVFTGFGAVRIDLSTGVILETYSNIGPNGSQEAIVDGAIFQDSLFVVTRLGVQATSLAQGNNRQDFRNWRSLPLPLGIANPTRLAAGNHLLLASPGFGVYRYQQGAFTLAVAETALPAHALRAEGNQFWYVAGNQLLAGEVGGTWQAISYRIGQQPRDVLAINGALWIADQQEGLLELRQQTRTNHTPRGPLQGAPFRLRNEQQTFFTLSGGFTPATFVPRNNLEGFSSFQAGAWSNFHPTRTGEGFLPIPPVPDLTGLAFHPLEGIYYLSSFGQGLWTFDPQTNQFQPVSTPVFVPTSGGNLAFTDVHIDLLGQVWVCQHGVPNGQPSAYRRDRQGNWQAFSFTQNAARFPLGLVTDFFGQVWMRLNPAFGGGILLFDSENRSRWLGEGNGNGGLPSRNVNALIRDLQGNIWAGTDRGVLEFFSPVDVLRNNLDGLVPRFEGRPLLRDEQVTALAADGGNRKWIGTRNGLWLFSADGGELVHHFTEPNSPLLRNEVLDVAIAGHTGEVMVATSAGLVSYRGTATTGQAFHQAVKVFPNPVHPSFRGLISISGLANQALVRITDVQGKLVFRTQANGGTAVWDGFTYQGKRAQTGVYLIFSSTEDGQEAFAGKFALIE
jgi:hypothetical protein